MRLSILICTLPKRKAMLDNLLSILNAKSYDNVEILIDDSSRPIGAKRNNLLAQSEGDYVCFVDDDDEVTNDYIELILEALKSNPDAVGIKGYMTTDGRNKKDWEISMEYKKWFEHNSIYYRQTNHLSPVRKEIALSVGFPEINHGEDYEYSIGLKGKLKTEAKIEKQIYHYKYISKK